MFYYKIWIKLFLLFIMINLFSNTIYILKNISNIIFFIWLILIYLLINYLNSLKRWFLIVKKNEILKDYLVKIYYILYLFNLYKIIYLNRISYLYFLLYNIINILIINNKIDLYYLSSIVNYIMNSFISFFLHNTIYSKKLLKLILIDIVLRFENIKYLYKSIK
jgi:hypothetical protein